MEEIPERRNLTRALNRVERNKGGAGVDGMKVDELRPYPTKHWPGINEELLSGNGFSEVVKRVEIPEKSGGKRKLGIPTCLDRLIRQAMFQVLVAGPAGAMGPDLFGCEFWFSPRPQRMSQRELDRDLEKIGEIIEKMADPDIFVWLERSDDPSEKELYRAATIVADRLCSAIANPIIRSAQEKRRLAAIGKWLTNLGYRHLPSGEGTKYDEMQPGTFSFRLNVPVQQEGTGKTINIPVDAVVMPKTAMAGDLPLLIEAKSAGDFTNVNKRRKEEATKMNQLRRTYGPAVRFNLFLCGYFDSGYLGYEAAEGIDWVWEHRIDDLGEFGL